MGDIYFSCTSCRKALSASKDDVGKLVKCPSCNQIVKVPRYGVVPGMKLGDLKILKFLGAGGMGEVWLAEQESLQRKVALKILSPENSSNQSFVNRFKQEVRTAGKLVHPNIIVAFDAGEQDGIRYLVTEYVDGLVASEALQKNGPMSEEEVLKIGRDVAKGLKYAWEKACILHRDVKPDNIMIANDGTSMLMDMGISKNLDEDASITMTGEIIGTLCYISPERAHASGNIDFRSDQYSLGATLFHLLTGRLPYHVTSTMGILAQHLQDPIPDPRDCNSTVSKECSSMIRKMMEKKPEDRYQTWDEIIETCDFLLNQKMRDTDLLPWSIATKKKLGINQIHIILLASIIIVSSVLAVLIAHKIIKQKNDKSSSGSHANPDKNINGANISSNITKPVGKPPIGTPAIKETNDADVHEEAQKRILDLLKQRFSSRVKEKFDITESQAEILADKFIIISLKRREPGRPKTNDSSMGHRRKMQKEMEPLKQDLFNTAREILGEIKMTEFGAFVDNEMRKPQSHSND